MGAGHTVTALYELVPADAKGAVPRVDPLRYQQAPAAANELLTVKIRYKEPREEWSKLLTREVQDAGRSFDKAPDDFRFAAAAAGFGLLLRHSPHAGSATFANVRAIADGALGLDARGHRAEMVRLIDQVRRLDTPGGESEKRGSRPSDK